MNTATRTPLITSLLDNDLYKFTMMQGAWRQYHDLVVEYNFTNRGATPFPNDFAQALREQVRFMEELSLTEEEYQWLKTNEHTKFFRPEFVEFLRTFRLRARDVRVRTRRGALEIRIRGPWFRTILWEVPLLALISELYFRLTGQEVNEEYFQTSLKKKTVKLTSASAKFAEFGTRRRFSQEIQERVVAYLKDNARDSLLGTSNVYLAMKYNLRPIGTQAHEWFMAHQGMFGSNLANQCGLESWLDEFNGGLAIALPDTFTSDVFFRDIEFDLAKQLKGLRQDSGNPYTFTEKAPTWYARLGIDTRTRTLFYSDAIDSAEKALNLLATYKELFSIGFGIGTWLTNDVGVKPLNIVIKLYRCFVNGRWVEVAKLSDNPGKHNGTNRSVRRTKRELGLS